VDISEEVYGKMAMGRLFLSGYVSPIQLSSKQKVAGSNPPGPPKFTREIIFIGRGFRSPPFALESLL
jgi:hypothetical protein